jgi:hypothetical protein
MGGEISSIINLHPIQDTQLIKPTLEDTKSHPKYNFEKANQYIDNIYSYGMFVFNNYLINANRNNYSLDIMVNALNWIILNLGSYGYDNDKQQYFINLGIQDNAFCIPIYYDSLIEMIYKNYLTIFKITEHDENTLNYEKYLLQFFQSYDNIIKLDYTRKSNKDINEYKKFYDSNHSEFKELKLLTENLANTYEILSLILSPNMMDYYFEIINIRNIDYYNRILVSFVIHGETNIYDPTYILLSITALRKDYINKYLTQLTSYHYGEYCLNFIKTISDDLLKQNINGVKPKIVIKGGNVMKSNKYKFDKNIKEKIESKEFSKSLFLINDLEYNMYSDWDCQIIDIYDRKLDISYLNKNNDLKYDVREELKNAYTNINETFNYCFNFINKNFDKNILDETLILNEFINKTNCISNIFSIKNHEVHDTEIKNPNEHELYTTDFQELSNYIKKYNYKISHKNLNEKSKKIKTYIIPITNASTFNNENYWVSFKVLRTVMPFKASIKWNFIYDGKKEIKDFNIKAIGELLDFSTILPYTNLIFHHHDSDYKLDTLVYKNKEDMYIETKDDQYFQISNTYILKDLLFTIKQPKLSKLEKRYRRIIEFLYILMYDIKINPEEYKSFISLLNDNDQEIYKLLINTVNKSDFNNSEIFEKMVESSYKLLNNEYKILYGDIPINEIKKNIKDNIENIYKISVEKLLNLELSDLIFGGKHFINNLLNKINKQKYVKFILF